MSTTNDEREDIERNVGKTREDFESLGIWEKIRMFQGTVKAMKQPYLDSMEGHYEDFGGEEEIGESFEVLEEKTKLVCEFGFEILNKFKTHYRLIEKKDREDRLSNVERLLKTSIEGYDKLIDLLERGQTEEGVKDLDDQARLEKSIEDAKTRKKRPRDIFDLIERKRKVVNLGGVDIEEVRALKKRAVDVKAQLFDIEDIETQAKDVTGFFKDRLDVLPCTLISTFREPFYKFDTEKEEVALEQKEGCE